MAIRTIREYPDAVLEKKAKPVKEMNDRMKTLVADMLETMYESGGVGLAAPQVGVLKRIVVIDVSEDQSEPHVLVNPVIVETEGEQCGYEGCLSVPGKLGKVKRPMRVVAEAFDENMEPVRLEGEELLARAICHELDHLDGRVYVELAEDGLIDADSQVTEAEEEAALEELDAAVNGE